MSLIGRGVERLTGGPWRVYQADMGRRAYHSVMRRITGWLCLAGIVLWALMPAGVMPARGSDGDLVFAICSGDGAVLMQIGADGAPHPVPAGDADHAKEPCPFAAAHLLARADAVPSAAPPALYAPQTLLAPSPPTLRVASPRLVPESRGPPVRL